MDCIAVAWMIVIAGSGVWAVSCFFSLSAEAAQTAQTLTTKASAYFCIILWIIAAEWTKLLSTLMKSRESLFSLDLENILSSVKDAHLEECNNHIKGNGLYINESACCILWPLLCFWLGIKEDM